MSRDDWTRSDLRGGSRLCRVEDSAAAALQVRRAGPARDAGQHAGRRARLHVDRRVRQAAGRAGLREPGARAVARSAAPRSASGSARASKAPWREVVGVVGDERDDGVDQKAPAIVLWPMLMAKFSGDEVFVRRTLAYVVRSRRTGSSGFVDEIGRAVWSVNPNLPLASVRDAAGGRTSESMARTSFTLVMLAIAGAMALLLGDRRHLRRDRVLGVAAHARDRHPHGARRAAPAR